MGIDPGLDGGIAILEENGSPTFYAKMPTKKIIEKSGKKKRMIDIAQVAAMIAKLEPEHVFIEQVSAMPKQGVSSTFTFGMGYGMLLGLCLALDPLLRTTLIRPQGWQKMLYAGIEFPESVGPKAKASLRFSQLFPELVQKNVSHDGIIDASLIAEYGRRFLNLN